MFHKLWHKRPDESWQVEVFGFLSSSQNFFGVLAARFESSQRNETFTFHSGTVAGTAATDVAAPGPLLGGGSFRISKLVLEQPEQRVACNSPFFSVCFVYLQKAGPHRQPQPVEHFDRSPSIASILRPRVSTPTHTRTHTPDREKLLGKTSAGSKEISGKLTSADLILTICFICWKIAL